MKKNLLKHSIFFIFLYLLIIKSFAQDFTEIKGVILREDSLSPIYGVVVYNKNGFLGTLSNKIGNFKMRVKPGDTLQITHLGYISQLIVFDESTIVANEKYTIILKIRSYELPSIDVRRYRIRDKYRQQPSTMRRTDNITYDAGAIRFENSGPYYFNPWGSAGANSLAMPVFGIPIGDWRAAKRELQLAKVRLEEAKDNKKKYINRKYSRELVNKLTGLKGNELENFMNFCKPSDETVMKVTEYELTYYILECYDKFVAENE